MVYGTYNELVNGVYKPTYTGWWFQTWFLFFHIWDVILPIDELIFFKMVNQVNKGPWNIVISQ